MSSLAEINYLFYLLHKLLFNRLTVPDSTMSDDTKIVSLTRSNWITWSDLMVTLLKSKDLHEHVDISTPTPEAEHADEAKAAFVLKKNISPDIYFLVRNLSRPREIWQALSNHFASTSKRNVQTRRRNLRDITIESCSYHIPTYLARKADAIDQLIAMDISVQDNQMCDIILEGLEMDTRLTEFLFFQSTQENDNYHKLITEIETYVTTPSFKLKYGNNNKTNYKAHNNRRNFNKKSTSNFKLGSGPSKSNVFHCDFCNKSGHTSDYCFVNPNSKKFIKKRRFIRK